MTPSFIRALGARATGEHLEALAASPQWTEGRFHAPLQPKRPDLWGAVVDHATNRGIERVPRQPLPVIDRRRREFEEAPPTGLRVTWLGHSTLLVELDGKRVLFDPVFSDRVSPVSFAGPKRFHRSPLPIDELPPLDAVAITHDHYDHLDYPAVLALAKLNVPFIVPLGVGAHLEHWGVPRERITEVDWWQATDVAGLTLVATPARHFSGRSPLFVDRDASLWCGFALIGDRQRMYYSGDTGMFPGFADIGERLGPFDVVMMESGAYNANWCDVHIGPEQGVLAAQMANARLFMPVHWGTFDLAVHAWTEPAERAWLAARRAGLPIHVPRPGESFEPSDPPEMRRWWPELEWKRVEDRPVVSSGLSRGILQRLAGLGAPAVP